VALVESGEHDSNIILPLLKAGFKEGPAGKGSTADALLLSRTPGGRIVPYDGSSQSLFGDTKSALELSGGVLSASDVERVCQGVDYRSDTDLANFISAIARSSRPDDIKHELLRAMRPLCDQERFMQSSILIDRYLQ
jgi:hypothetical protein